ncbi:MAG TPA: hypothetical protein VLJ39_15485 [Tepidisphaeraceae bacterium]|jgi:hypothetical protein|nr:hypothetical protein [Tepidisphaeraceae bacterium]
MNPSLTPSSTVATSSASQEATPNGPVWAGVLAAGIGCAAFGVLVDLCEASKGISKALNFYNPTGDLSGKTTVAILVWLLAWGALAAAWKRREFRSGGTILTITIVLVLLSILAVFPPFIDLFSH